jgi:Recombinase
MSDPRRATHRKQLADQLAQLGADPQSIPQLAVILDQLHNDGWQILTETDVDQIAQPANKRLTLHRLERIHQLGLGPLIDRGLRDGFGIIVATSNVAIVAQHRGRGRLPEIAPHTRERIRQAATAGKTPAEIAHDLQADGIRTARDGRWSASTVRRLLETYPPDPPKRGIKRHGAGRLARARN